MLWWSVLGSVAGNVAQAAAQTLEAQAAAAEAAQLLHCSGLVVLVAG
ncbi:hypothetical protein [Anaplasma ovis]|nr:hypothetical protein [Anaplasma ovis]